jgi:hypothetical protein
MLGKLKPLGQNFMEMGDPKPHQPISIWGWRLAVVLCVLLLMGQVYFFEKDQFIQQPSTRLWLQKICQSFNCQLPIYKNRRDLAVIYAHFQAIANQHYIFQAVISNQGLFKQHYPNLKLTLLSFSGEPFAQRIFTPANYLVTDHPPLMLPLKTVEISMEIAMPNQKVGGYTVKLI